MPREMKESGIEWIGKIPIDWDLRRLQYSLNEIVEKNNPIQTTNVLSLVKDKGIMPYEEKGNQGNKAKEDPSEYKIAYPNTLVVNSMNILIGSVGISNYFGCVSPVYYVFKETDKSDLRYVNYIFQTREFQKELRKYAKGILEIRLRVSSQDIFKRDIPFPDKTEQQKIANFLDEKVGEIDRVIAKTKESIEEYKKYRQSIISTSVTKGIDSNVTLKDSKVDWIGEIPKHWSIDKIKYSAKIRNEKYNDTLGALDYFGLENIESWSNKYFKTDSIYDLNGSQICKKDDLVFGKLRPYLSKVYKVNYDRCCSSEFAVIYDFKGSIDYLMYLMSSLSFIDYINMSTYGTKMPRANIEFIKNSFIPLPSLEEQLRIVEFIQNKVKSIDELLNLKNSYIVQLEQYKKSLIYEYVTGKKEVR